MSVLDGSDDRTAGRGWFGGRPAVGDRVRRHRARRGRCAGHLLRQRRLRVRVDARDVLRCRAGALDADGRAVAAGFAHVDGTIAQGVMLARFSANGALDGSFGTGGVVVTDLPDRFDEASAVAIAPDGKVVVAGGRATMPSSPVTT